MKQSLTNQLNYIAKIETIENIIFELKTKISERNNQNYINNEYVNVADICDMYDELDLLNLKLKRAKKQFSKLF